MAKGERRWQIPRFRIPPPASSVYAVTDVGGVFKSSDTAASWSQVARVRQIRALAIDWPDVASHGLWDAFVAKVNAAGTALVYCGYIGGGGYDAGHGIAVDSSGNAYITGETNSTEATFPVTVGPDLTFNGSQDGFVAKITQGASFWTVAPCRLIDTRNPDGPLGGPALAGGSARTFAIVNQCGIPSDATDVSVNVTITRPSAAGHLTFYPTGVTPPLVSTINYRSGQTRANNAILLLGPAGNFDVSSAGVGTVDFILDVNGYFR